jgi:hypothetical protein
MAKLIKSVKNVERIETQLTRKYASKAIAKRNLTARAAKMHYMTSMISQSGDR